MQAPKKLKNRSNKFSIKFPSYKKHILNKELPLLVLNDPTEKVVQLDFISMRGYGKDLTTFIAPQLLTATLDKSMYKNESCLSIIEKINHYGASLTVGCREYYIYLRLTTLSKHIKTLLPLVKSILSRPNFQNEVLEREKIKIAQQIDLDNVSTNQLASKKLFEILFGRKHPYGYNISHEDLQKASTEMLNSYFNKYCWKKGCLVLSGNISKETISDLDFNLNDLPTSAQSDVEHKIISHQKNSHSLNLKGAQTSIAMGMITININNPDYILLYITTVLLGGYFGSRLMQNLREKQGYTYNVFCHLNSFPENGVLKITTDVKQGYGKLVCCEIDKEIERLKNTLPSEEELNRLKNYLYGATLHTFDNIFSTASRLISLHLFNLSLKNDQLLLEALNNLKAEEIKEIANRYFKKPLYRVLVNE